MSATDWRDIRAAHAAILRAVVPAPDGHVARHPGQRWRACFDGRGFTVEPDGGGWTFGLELARWGRAGAWREIAGLASGCARGEQLEYGWGGALTEWWVNGANGLEHGFTVHRRPADGAGALTFVLRLRGTLTTQVDPDGRGTRFVDASGAVALTYSGLAVHDARGRALDARLDRCAEGLLLSVEDDGAVYPLTIDPTAQQAYLKASNTDAGDNFGFAVALSGDTAAVSAPLEASAAVGVNGNEADDSAGGAGAVYVFVRSGASWSQQAYLKASNTAGSDLFGRSVAISGDTLVVGAPSEDSNATGVNGNQADNSASASGAAYVFVRTGTAWSQQAYLKASNTGGGDAFGWSVAVSGDTAVVGARLEDSSATGVDGNGADNSAISAGAAYVFVRSGTAWSQQAYLKASNAEAQDIFGWSVAVSGDTVAVGAFSEDSSATGVNGNQADNGAFNSGAVYVYSRGGTTWSQQAYLKASNTGANDEFGGAVALSLDTAVVGADAEASNATGVNGNEADNSASEAGAAYVFVRSGTVWSQQAYLKASNTDAGDLFGESVAVSGDTALVGAYFEDSNAAGVNGNQADNSASLVGAAYLFVRSGSLWIQEAYLKASNAGAMDLFGGSVAVSGGTALVGARNEDCNATGVNGNQTDESAADAGAAYVFVRDPVLVAFCSGDGAGTACPCGNAGLPEHGCASSLNPNGARLVASGTPSIASDSLVLSGSGMSNAPCLYFQGTGTQNAGLGLTFGDGLRCAAGTTIRLKIALNVAGASQFPAAGDPPISLPGMIGAPGTRSYQVWYRDAVSYCTKFTFNLTNGVLVAWQL